MRYLRLIFGCFFAIMGVVTVAQNIVLEPDTTADEVIESNILDSITVVPADVTASLDEVLHNWFVEHSLMLDCEKADTIISYPDSIFIERLQKLPYTIPMPYNSVVNRMINHYLRNPKSVEYMLGLGEAYYFPMFETILEKHHMPLELRYLPVIESALNARAMSRAGACGLWQFMVTTGKSYGLEVNSLVDERCDPLKATEAAARYLKDLYTIYGDWHLAIAAYNCGPGNVAKAIRYAGGKKNYWDIYPFLPSETRGYVPIFIAANYILNYYEAHNLCPAKPTMTVTTDTLMISDRVHLQQISEILEIPLDELRFLNPQYRRDLIPGNSKPYALVLPLNKVDDYLDNRDTILVHNKALVQQVGLMEPPKEAVYAGGLIYHKIRQGETLSSIAKKYRVSVNQIKRWNNLNGTFIRAGKKLKIYK